LLSWCCEASRRQGAIVAANDIIAQLGGWEGYEVVESCEEQRGERRWCVIRLQPLAGQGRCCSGCGEMSWRVHDTELRRVRDLPIFEVPVELVVPRIRVLCSTCGPKLERLSWLAAYSRVTQRLATSVSRLCAVMSVRHVAGFYGLA